MQNKMEFRGLSLTEMRVAAGSKTLSGYAARFGILSEPLGNFREKIAHGAFTRTLQHHADVRMLINHDPSLLLGRTASGTLSLAQDANGLAFQVSLPETSYANDLLESVKRGDVSQCSFGFVCKSDSWSRDSEGGSVRELLDVELFDTSVVTYPAYPETSVGVRGAAGEMIDLRWYRGDKRIAMPMPGWVRSQILNKERENILATESEAERLRLRVELAKRL